MTSNTSCHYSLSIPPVARLCRYVLLVILKYIIYFQDQLDDAHRPGEEKKDEERDCKEEEKGVNMTDDFDSHLQDVDKKGTMCG